MLKYVIALCIISFFNSMASQTGRFDELVLAIRYPVTTFFYEYILSPYVNTTSDQFMNYWENHRTLLQSNDWTIHGLRSYNSEGELLLNCVNTDGQRPILQYGSLETGLRNDLMIKWPRLVINGVEEDSWVQQFNDIGSCVTNSPDDYFRLALYLLSQYDPGPILDNAEIQLDSYLQLSEIVSAMANVAEKQIYVNCLRCRVNEVPLLMEIQLCFNANIQIKDCEYRRNRINPFQCPTRRRNIYYPIAPVPYR